MWTPPHFWALALYRARDYERAGVPMLPVVAGPDETRKQIVIYSALLVPLALCRPSSASAAPLYALTSIVLGGMFLALALNVYHSARAARPTAPPSSCSRFSILYLFLLFAVLLLEQGVARLSG